MRTSWEKEGKTDSLTVKVDCYCLNAKWDAGKLDFSKSWHQVSVKGKESKCASTIRS